MDSRGLRTAALRALFSAAVILQFSHHLAAVSLSEADADNEKTIGWQGEVATPGARLRGGLNQNDLTSTPWVEVISFAPRAFLYHNFLSAKECLYLIHKAAPLMKNSQVVDSKTGRPVSSSVRTSQGMFLRRGEDEVIQRIEKRIADFSFIPVDHGESIHVLHYQDGQEYKAHFDYFHDSINTKNGGQRIATLLMYLSDVEEGGETTFPAAEAASSASPSASECAKSVLSVKPKRGDALLFWSLKPDATLDPKSLHSGCPVLKGSKWSATKWMRVNPLVQ